MSGSGLNVNASAFVPSSFGTSSQEPSPQPLTDTQKSECSNGHDATVEVIEEQTPANHEAHKDTQEEVQEVGEEDYDADLEEVMNALEEMQEEQIHREVEAQLMQEMAEAGLDDYYDDDSSSTASDYNSNQYSHGTPPGHRQGSGAPQCKFTPTCRAGSRACKFSHEHMGFCKFGGGCRNPSCNFIH